MEDYFDDGEDEYQYKGSDAFTGNYDLGIIHENPDDEIDQQSASKKSSPEDGYNSKVADLGVDPIRRPNTV